MCQAALRLAFLNPGLPGIIGAPTYPMLRDVTRARFREILDVSMIPYEWRAGDNSIRLLDTSSLVMFRSMSDPDRLRGPNLAWYACDELTYSPKASWQQLQARLRDTRARKLQAVAACTPKGFDWFYDEFVAQRSPEYELIRGTPGENAVNLAPGFYEALRRSYDERFYKQEVLGEFLPTFAGQAYWAFNRFENVRAVEYDPALDLVWTLDFNVDPMCSLVIQVRPELPPRFHGEEAVPVEVRVIDELILRSSSTYDAAREFLARWGFHSHGLRIYGDPAGGQRQHTASTESDWQLIRRVLHADDQGRRMRPEFRVARRAPALKDRIQAVNGLLCNADGERRLFVNPKCEQLIADFERVAYKPGTTLLEKGYSTEEERMRTHTSDALGYFVWQEFPLRGSIGDNAAGRIV